MNDLSISTPALAELLDLAKRGPILLRTPDGRKFVLAEVDDFAQEVAMVRQNAELTQFRRTVEGDDKANTGRGAGAAQAGIGEGRTSSC